MMRNMHTAHIDAYGIEGWMVDNCACSFCCTIMDFRSDR